MTPQELAILLHGNIGHAALQVVLDTLATDPAWTIQAVIDQPPERVFVFTYQPTGVSYTFRGRRLDPVLWRFEG